MNPPSSFYHQFIISDSHTGQSQFEDQHFDAYGSAIRGSNAFPQSLGAEISHSRHLMNLLGAENETNHQAQRLSLSLNSLMLVPSVQYRQRSGLDLISPNYLVSGEEEEEREAFNPPDEYSFTGGAFASSSASLNRSSSASYRTESFAIAVGNSRYLKPAQSLLEEIVHMGGMAIDISNEKYATKLYCGGRGGPRLSSELKAELGSNELLSVEKHELQVKIAKLIALLEEVESRYEKYFHQMEEVVSSFEMIVGLGAAKSYTALALQAMSRHFCSLRDSILSQINVYRRKFSQDLPKISTGLSQLSLFDTESRHNRMSLQQLGRIQSQRQAWRPIRGLPESSVTILRSWLFEHFLHPYPNDTEKLMLASQTGLTKNQVSNWFINARVRLWKPMIEEMYKEEFGDKENITDNTEE